MTTGEEREMIPTRTGESLLPSDCQVQLVGVQVAGRRLGIHHLLARSAGVSLESGHVILSTEGVPLAWFGFQQRSDWHLQNAVWLLP